MDARSPLIAFACLFAAAATAPAADLPPRGSASPVVSWKELRFAARKAGISATIELRLDRQPGDGADGVVLESTTHLPGRTFLARESIDAADAGAREIVDTETGVKHHRKTYTLGDRGFRFDLVEPASLAEAMLAPEEWTKRTSSFTAYPRALPPGAAVTGPAGLLYAASAARLASPGDSLTVNVLVQTQVERVTLRVEGSEPVDLAFEEHSEGRLNAVREQVSALRLVARSQPVDAESASAFRIFGLDGDVVLLWDPARRLPVEIAGHVKLLGQVEVRLASVTLP